MCRLILILFLILITPWTGFAQKDTTNVYQKIEKISKKKKITSRLYRSIFRSTVKEDVHVRKPRKETFSKDSGKVIRSITIISTDPFGYSIDDSSKKPVSVFQDVGNGLHMKTKAIAIKNIILLRKGQRFDPYKARESERLIRATGYIRDVKLTSVTSGDSTDVTIRVIDLWTIIPAVRYSPGVVGIRIRDRNFLGIGNDFNNYVLYDQANRSYSGSYIIPTLGTTHISMALALSSDNNVNLVQSVSLARPFYSPNTRYAGGIFFGKLRSEQKLFYPDSVVVVSNVSDNTFDIWAARSWPVITYSKNERTNFVMSMRYENIVFNSIGNVRDTFLLFPNERFFLMSTGLVYRKFNTDNYLFKFGQTEDVPGGSMVSVTLGKQYRDSDQRYYAGLKLGRSFYLNHSGYVNLSFQYGSFIKDSRLEQAAVNGMATYFTDLFETGRWKFRDFVQASFTSGFQRNLNEALTFYGDANGIRGFQNSTAYGTARMIFTNQFQAYAPYNILGFRFGPTVYFSGGLISYHLRDLFQRRFYSAFGLGLLVRNEFLVLSNFEVSIAFYPAIPGDGKNVWLYKPFSASNFVLEDFRIERPETAAYR